MLRTISCLIAASLLLPLEICPAGETDRAKSNADQFAAIGVSTNRFDDFSLVTTIGTTVSFSADPTIKLHVVCFLGTECPLARVYGPGLNRMAAEYASEGVEFIGVNSNVQDSMDDLKGYVKEHEISFPIGKDYDRKVALQSGATRTPEVFVVDQAGVIRYQGRIDDQYKPGIARSTAKVHDLRAAIDQLLAGKPVDNPKVEAVGCLIALPRKAPSESDVTYCNQVIRILQKNCIECHRSGQIGPFVLDDYDEVVGWADMSIEVIDNGRMPPWHADPNVGQFANARYMPDEEKETLRKWVDAGMPYGEVKDLPPKQTYADGWRMSKEPDLILEMSDKPYAVPSEGTVEYQYFVVDPGFTEDTWIRGSQVIPGNSSVVHHCIVFQRPPDGSYLKGAGMLAGYVPGQITSELPDGYAYRIVAGAHLVFQMHYTPNGKPQEDLTQLGLVFAKPEEVTNEVYVINGIDTEFEIPPGVANHEVEAEVEWFPKDGEILSLTPHMHVRGKSLAVTLYTKDGPTPLLRVPSYDFNWQHDYDLATPIPLDNVNKISFKAVFDNSNANPSNPDPTQYVAWGDQTWEEMALTFLRVAEPLDPEERFADRKEVKAQNEAEQRIKWDLALDFADKYIARFDDNDDKLLSPQEVPKSVRAFRFHYYDQDGNRYLTRDEIAANALQRYEAASSAKSALSAGKRKL
jgi:peroxiredoxin